MTLRTAVYYDFEQLLGLRESWNCIVAGGAMLSFFQQFEWFEAWWRVFAGERELHVLAVFAGEELVGVIPLVRQTYRFGVLAFKILRFPADDISDYYRIIAAPGFEQAVCDNLAKYLRNHPREWDLLFFKEIPESAYRVVRDSLAPLRFPSLHEISSRTFNLPIQTYWEAYWRSLSGHLRRYFDRQTRLMPDYRVKRYRGREITPEVIETIVAINCAAAAIRRAGSIFLHPQYRRFHLEHLLNGPLKEQVLISILYIGARPVTYHYSFVYKNRMLNYNCCHDDNFSRFSVGTMLDLLNLQYVFEVKMEALDFLRGNSIFKKRFQAKMHENHTFGVFRNVWFRWSYGPLRAFYLTALRGYSRWIPPIKIRLAAALQYCGRGGRFLKAGRIHSVPPDRLPKNAGRILFQSDCYLASIEVGAVQLPPAPGHVRDYTLRELTACDYDWLKSFVGCESMPGLLKRFWSGYRCWGILHHDRLIGFQWFAQHPMKSDQGFSVLLKRDELYLYDGVILPEYRRRGIMQLFLNLFLHESVIRPFRCVIMRVEVHNRPLLRLLRRFNFTLTEHIRIRKFGFLFKQISRCPVVSEAEWRGLDLPKPVAPSRSEEFITRR